MKVSPAYHSHASFVFFTLTQEKTPYNKLLVDTDLEITFLILEQ